MELIHLAQLTGHQVVKKLPHFIEPAGALPPPVAILSRINPVHTPSSHNS